MFSPKEFFGCCQFGRLSRIVEMTKFPNADLNWLNPEHAYHSGFSIACCYGRVSVVKHLLTIPSIDVNSEHGMEKVSPFLHALRSGCTDVVRLLLRDERVHVCGELERDPLVQACIFSQSLGIRLLLASGRYHNRHDPKDVFENGLPIWPLGRKGSVVRFNHPTIRDYMKHPEETTKRLRKELKFNTKQAEIFVISGIIGDGLLAIQRIPGAEERSERARRFWKIMEKLHFDLQMLLSNRCAMEGRDFICVEDRRIALSKVLGELAKQARPK